MKLKTPVSNEKSREGLSINNTLSAEKEKGHVPQPQHANHAITTEIPQKARSKRF